MNSPYFDIYNKYLTLYNEQFTCEPTLSLDYYEQTNYLGSSASGMVLGKGRHKNIPVFVKIFPTTCNYQVLNKNDKIIRRKKIEFDRNALEIGITCYFSDLLFYSNDLELIPFTQNLVAVYGKNTCDFAYESDISPCSGQFIPNHNNFLIKDSHSHLPQYRLKTAYLHGQYDDKINYMIVEHCSGDLETFLSKLFREYNKYNIDQYILNELCDSIFLQISLTIYMLNEILGNFYHNDLGPRNVLYTEDLNENSYFKYIIYGIEYNVKHCGIIPKLWDFSYMYLDDNIRNILKTTNHFDYLRPEDEFESAINERIDPMIQLCTQICTIPTYHLIKDTNIDKKIQYILNNKLSLIEIIDMFNTFKITDEILLEPIFQFN